MAGAPDSDYESDTCAREDEFLGGESDEKSAAVCLEVPAAADSVGDGLLTPAAEAIDTFLQIQKLGAFACCKQVCLSGNQEELHRLLSSRSRMSKDEAKISLNTKLAMCSLFADGKTTQLKRQKVVHQDSAERSDEGRALIAQQKPRQGIAYYAPYVGGLCEKAFESLFSISHRTLHVYRMQIQSGDISARRHGNHQNSSSKDIDEKTLEDWIYDVANTIGDVVPVRTRTKRIISGVERRYYSFDKYVRLPSHLTWDQLHTIFLTYLDDNYIDTPRPSASSFNRILAKRCPKIRIRSPRNQVCDECAIYSTRLGSSPGAQDAELMAEHIQAAKAMRDEYAADVSHTSPSNLVLIVDYAQNLTLPLTPDTPSKWYFLSLVSVSMFGIYCANDESNFNYLYSEMKGGGKGPNEVISMLRHILQLHHMFDSTVESSGGHHAEEMKVTVWCDNSGGQNKNSYVIWFLLLLVDCGVVIEAYLKFFQKGHTKNACDRGFAHVKRRLARVSCWNMEFLVSAVDSASSTSVTIFTVKKSNPGKAECRRTPTSDPQEVNVRKGKPGSNTTTPSFADVMVLVPKLKDPPPNVEKKLDIHEKVLPFVPAEYANDPLYQTPTAVVESSAKKIKQDRRKRYAERMKAKEVEKEQEAEKEQEEKEALV
ncbi:hypothetical protein PF004_g20666 [Phytophthora fragariae]|uniref:DUF7869 domain-containing protein n=2 Tax=Phytophthora fragariae TaxID=53985 RepID=A0A6G0N6G8_9STRA|nr:hypothetical protein PF004_g20666 [Phytophthora fragariae]